MVNKDGKRGLTSFHLVALTIGHLCDWDGADFQATDTADNVQALRRGHGDVDGWHRHVADSGNRAMAGQGEEMETSAEGAADSPPPELLRRDSETASFESEDGGSGGWGGGGGGAGGGGVRASGGSRAAIGSGRIAVPGYEQAFIDRLTDEEYRAFLQTLPPEMRGDRDMTPDRAAQRAAVEAASARRAGQSGAGSDGPG